MSNYTIEVTENIVNLDVLQDHDVIIEITSSDNFITFDTPSGYPILATSGILPVDRVASGYPISNLLDGSAIVRTSGNQDVSGIKTFYGDSIFVGNVTSSGSYSIKSQPGSTSATQFPVFLSDPSSSSKVIYTRTPSQIRSDLGISDVQNIALSGITFTAGSGLVGGGALSSSRSFDIGQGDGLTVSADSISIDSTVVRSSNVDQVVSGIKTFSGSGLVITSPSGTYKKNIALRGSSGLISNNVITIAPVSTIYTNRTYYLPEAGADADFVMTAGGQVITGPKTFTNTLVFNSGSFQSLKVGSTDVALNGHTHTSSNITDFNTSVDSRITNANLQPSGNYSVVGHTHTSSNITDFNSSVSGLLPVKNIVGTNYVTISSTTGNYTISVTGLQPSGSYASSSHTHTSSDITNFNASVSGLVSGIYAPLFSPSFSGVPLVPTASAGTNTQQIANTSFVRTEISNLVASAPSALDTLNELATALGNDANFSTTVTNNLASKASLSGAIFTGSISGPSGNFTSLKVNGVDVSASGHTHTASNITDFNSAVSGLIPTFSTELDVYVKNTTGGNLYKGQVVYINGAQGDHPTITLAMASSEMTSSKTLGLLKQDLLVNEFGYVVSEGALDGIDTSSANAAGDTMWLSPTVSGGIVYGLSNKPSAPNHMVFLGYVLRKQLNNGKVYVKVQNGYELEELHNVAISGVTNGQFLQYNSSSGLWMPSSSGNFSSLSVNSTGVSVNGHTHTSSNITDFNSSVSGLLTPYQLTLTNPVTGTGTTNYHTKWVSSSGIGNSLIFDNGTNVGIGTVTPSSLLHIEGSVRFKENTYHTLATKPLFGGNGSTLNYLYSANTALIIRNSSDSTDLVRINDDGRVGIGISPTSQLHVIGTGLFTSGIIVGNNSNNSYIYGAINPITNNIRFNNGGGDRIDFNSSQLFYVGTSYFQGNNYVTRVGETTSTATQKDSYQLVFQNALWDGAASQYSVSTITSIASTSQNLMSRLAFRTHNSSNNTQVERMCITSSGGYVGIGTSSPSYQIDVSGSGNFTFAGNSIIIDPSGKSINSSATDIFIKANNKTVFRGLDAAAWTDNVNTTYFQVGTFNANCAFASQSANPFTRLGFSAANFHFTPNYINTVAAPTAMFQVDGASTIGNLVVTSAGSVGVGTTSPSTQLHVVGTGIFDNLAIGTTGTSVGATSYKLLVDGDVSIGSGNANRSLTIYGNHVSAKRTVIKNVNGDSFLSFAVGSQNLSLGETGGLRFNNINYYAGSSTAGLHRFFVSNDTTPEVVIGSGSLGIGTTTPSGQLHVVGTGLFTNIDINGSVLAGSASLTVNGGILTQGAFVRTSIFSLYGDNNTKIYKPDGSTLGYSVSSSTYKHSFGYDLTGNHNSWATISSSGLTIGSSTLSSSNLPSIINNTNLYLWSNFN